MSRSTTDSAPSIPHNAIFWLSVLRTAPPPCRFLYIIPYFVSHCNKLLDILHNPAWVRWILSVVFGKVLGTTPFYGDKTGLPLFPATYNPLCRTFWAISLQGFHLCNCTKGVTLLLEIGDNIRQRLNCLAGGFGIVQQDNAGVMAVGVAADVARRWGGWQWRPQRRRSSRSSGSPCPRPGLLGFS